MVYSETCYFIWYTPKLFKCFTNVIMFDKQMKNEKEML